MKEQDAAKLVADSLNFLRRQASLPAISEASHRGDTVRFQDSFSDRVFEVVVRQVG
jgi:hypothetical protein